MKSLGAAVLFFGLVFLFSLAMASQGFATRRKEQHLRVGHTGHLCTRLIAQMVRGREEAAE